MVSPIKNDVHRQRSVAEIWNPADYDTANGLCLQDAIDLINELKKEASKINVVFEIGCGSGNITQTLSNSIGPKKFMACDLSQEMIEYASKTYCRNQTVEYILQDFGVNWEDLDPRIRNLEGRVDLVFSSYTMHLIGNQENAVMNISRLLKSGGRCCVVFPAILFYNESESQKMFLKKEEHVNWIPKGKQFELFINLFSNADFRIHHSEIGVMEWTFPSVEEFNKLYLPVSQAYAHHILKPNTPENIKGHLITKYKKLFLNYIREKDVDKISTANNCEPVKVYVDRFRFMCLKK